MTEKRKEYIIISEPEWRNGILCRLKICRPQGHTGSSPVSGTNERDTAKWAQFPKKLSVIKAKEIKEIRKGIFNKATLA